MKKLITLTVATLLLGTIPALHHDSLDGFVANEHIDWTGASVDLMTSGNVKSGTDDTTAGVFKAYGAGTEVTDGGCLQLHTAADYDTTIGVYQLNVDEDDLVLKQGATTKLTLSGATGNFTFACAGHDSFTDFVANEHLDWTADQGATNIHAGNLTGSPTFTNITATGSITGYSFVLGGGGSDIGPFLDTDLLQLAANVLTVNGTIDSGNLGVTGTVTASSYIYTDAYVRVKDPLTAHYLSIGPLGGVAFTATRSLTVELNNASRTITFSGNPTLADWFDQSVKSGQAPTFTADNFSDGGSNAIVTTTQETNWDNHIADDSQAHTDYLKNDADDSTSGGITTAKGVKVDSIMRAPFIIQYAVSDADGDNTYNIYNSNAPVAFRVIDVWSVNTAANTTAPSWDIKNGANRIVIKTLDSTSDKAISRLAGAHLFDHNYWDVAANGTLAVTTGAKSGNYYTLFIECVPADW